MKKIATILMACAILSVGSFSLSAQKSSGDNKAKSKMMKSKSTPARDRNSESANQSSGSANQSSGLSANMFLQPFSQSGENADDYGIARSQASKIMIPKDDKSIDASLSRLGFNKEYRTTSEVWNDAIDEMMPCNNACFTKEIPSGKITVTEECGYWEINFPTTDEKNKFLKTAEDMGYRYNSGWGAYIVPGTEDDYWIANFIFVDGNTISIHPGGE